MAFDIQIHPITKGHPFAETVTDWIQEEWGDPLGRSREETMERTLDDSGCPMTRVAACADTPLGLVAFRRFPRPHCKPDDAEAIWIDALYVASEARNQGIASRLVAHAENLVAQLNEEEVLYVYTDIPEFYARLGWRSVVGPNEDGCSKLMKDLSEVADDPTH